MLFNKSISFFYTLSKFYIHPIAYKKQQRRILLSSLKLFCFRCRLLRKNTKHQQFVSLIKRSIISIDLFCFRACLKTWRTLIWLSFGGNRKNKALAVKIISEEFFCHFKKDLLISFSYDLRRYIWYFFICSPLRINEIIWFSSIFCLLCYSVH